MDGEILGTQVVQQDDEPRYYALRSPGNLCKELVEQIEHVRSARRLSFLAGRLRRNWLMYYGLDDGAARMDDNLYATGRDGEKVRLRSNHFRNIIQHMHVMTTSTRPVLDCKAANTDEKSIRQTEIANSVIEHYFETEDVYRYIDRAVEQALVLTAGFMHVEWDASAGQPYAVKPPPTPDEGAPPGPPPAGIAPLPGGEPTMPGATPDQPMMPTPETTDVSNSTQQAQDVAPGLEDLIFQGDLKFSNPTLFDVFFDQSADSFEDISDIIVRSWPNKYNIIARFPDLEQEIDSAETKKQWNNVHLELPAIFYNPYDSNQIEMFTYYHKKTAAVPKGRMSIFLADGTVLYDGDLPYDRIPVFRVVASEMLSTPQGFSPATDIAPLQEGFDRLMSALFTNQATFATQNIAIARQADVQIQELDGGLNAVYYTETGGPNGGKPEALQLTKSPAEAFTMMELLLKGLETISGINSVARGNPPPGMDAGVALSLVQTMAIQFMNGLQKSYASLLRDLGMFIIGTLRTYAQAPRLINIVGVSKQASLKEFVGSDLEGISRVTVDMGNPLARTVAGRMQIAKALIDSGMAIDPAQYLQVLATGRLEPMTESANAQMNLVRGENELLMKGKPVMVLAGDDDVLHLKEHMALLSNPDVRKNAKYVVGVLKHCNEHQQKYLAGDLIQGIVSGRVLPGPQMPPQPGATPPPGGAAHGPGGAPPPTQGGQPHPQQSPERRPPAQQQPAGVVPQPNFPTPAPEPRVTSPGT